MGILIAILAVVCLWGIKFSDFHEDYMSLRSANAIKGVFAVLILYKHMGGYLKLSGMADRPFIMVTWTLGQLVVTMYLFYSGFGIAESARKKPGYFGTFFKQRIVRTLVHFDIAVLCYMIASRFTGISVPWINYITCWVGFGAVGNSAWFVFDILALYCFTLFAFKLLKGKNSYRTVLLITALSMVLWAAMKYRDAGPWWYNTILCFPLGIWYSLERERIESVLRDRTRSLILILLSAGIFVAWYHFMGIDDLGICACLFTLALTFLSSKVRLDNKVLQWLGVYSFAIYIMQRLPMNTLAHLGLDSHRYLFALITIPTTLLIAWGYQQLMFLLDRRFFKK